MARPLMVASLVVGGLLSLGVAILRLQVEGTYRQVALVADWDEVRMLAAEEGRPLVEVLETLRREGLTGVALPEDTLQRLADEGRLEILSGPRSVTHEAQGIAAGLTLWSAEPRLLRRVAEALQGKYPRQRLQMALGPDQGWLWLGDLGSRALRVGLGLDRDRVQQIRAAGLEVIPRLENDPLLTPESLAGALEALQRENLRLFIPSKDEVLGFPRLLPQVAQALQRRGILYGDVEFSKQKGAEGLGALLGGNLVRVHSITVQEMPTLAEPQAIARFLRAVRERNIRLCFLRLYLLPDADRWERNLSYLRSLARALQEAGFQLGSANAVPDFHPAPWVALLIGLAAYGAILAGWCLLFPGMGVGMRWWGPPGALLALALGLVASDLFRKGAALGVAVAFPTAGGLWAWRWLRGKEALSSWRAILGKSLFASLTVSGISALGALFIVGLLSEQSFMAAVERFAGVKVSLLLPLLLVGLAMGAEPWEEGPPRQWREAMERWRKGASQPVLLWHAVMILALAGVALLLLLRSGSEVAAVPEWERRLRDVLERLLWVRPRTKEWLIGHPALLLTFALALSGRRRWLGAFLLAGMVGQVSLVNTFCHIHTPLLISIVRTMHGLWLGWLLGGMAFLLGRRMFPSQQEGSA